MWGSIIGKIRLNFSNSIEPEYRQNRICLPGNDAFDWLFSPVASMLPAFVASVSPNNDRLTLKLRLIKYFNYLIDLFISVTEWLNNGNEPSDIGFNNSVKYSKHCFDWMFFLQTNSFCKDLKINHKSIFECLNDSPQCRQWPFHCSDSFLGPPRCLLRKLKIPDGNLE